MLPEPDRAREDLSIELVRRIQAGDRAALDDLYRRYRDPLLFAIRARLGAGLRRSLESEDVLHSVFRDALGDLQRFEPRGSGSLAHWLHACVLNKIRSKAEHFGAQKRRGAVALTDSAAEAAVAPAPELSYLDSQRWGRLEQALAQIDAQAREVVLLRTVEGLSNQEAARVLGREPAATSKLYTRALARLGILLAARKEPA